MTGGGSPTVDRALLRRRRYLPYLFESLAREVALTVLDVTRGERVLEIGVGVGEVLLKIAALTGPEGRAVGIDASPPMLRVAEARLAEVGYGSFELRLSALPEIPADPESFDGVYCAYALGRLPADEAARALAEIRRVLRPGGRASLCGFTAGERALSRTLSAGWAMLSRLSPKLGGRTAARSLRGASLAAGFEIDRRLYLEQRGVPSEVLLLRRSVGLGVVG